jgi:hypothetical protein
MEEIKAEEPQEEKPTPKSIVDQLFKERDQYQQATQAQRGEVNEIYAAYAGQITDVKDRSKSQEKIMKLRTETAYIVPSIFSGQPEIEVEPVGEEDKDFALVAEKIINYRLETINQAYEKIEAWVKQASVFGTSLIKVIWKFDTEKNEDGTETPVTDEPDLEVPNLLDCFYNPIISDVECQNSIIFRSVLPVEDVKSNPIYDSKDENGIENRTKLVSGSGSSIDQFNSSQQLGSDKISTQKASEGMIEVYERFSKDRIQTVAEGKERLLLRDIENPDGFMPTVKLIHEPNAIPNRFDGFGIGHNTAGLGKLYQKMLNRTLDSVALTNNPFFLFKKGAGIDARQLVVKTGGGVEVEGDKPLSEYIQAIQFPDVKQGAIEVMNKIDDEHKRASGANDLLQGAASNKTLGQDQIASTYSSNRFELINRRFKQALADVARMILKMELSRIQSMDAEILRIFPLQAELQNGEVMYSRETVYQMLISPEAQDAKFNIKVKGNTNVAKNKDMQIKQLIETYNLFGPILPPENQMEWARKILELRGIDELDKLVPSPEALRENAMMQAGVINPQMGVTSQQPQI